MVYGSSYDENSFQVDGVDVTDNYFNEALAEPNTDAIEEVEILSLGAPAEYGNLTGAVYNIVTRQGTNEFHGDLGFYWQSDGLTSDNTKGITNPDGSFMDACPDGQTRCPWTRDNYTDVSAQLGGPIVKDKLWFFASYANQRDYSWDVGVDSIEPVDGDPRSHRPLLRQAELADQPQAQAGRHLPPGRPRRRPGSRAQLLGRDGRHPDHEDADARPRLHRHPVGQDGGRGALLGLLRRRARWAPRIPTSPATSTASTTSTPASPPAGTTTGTTSGPTRTTVTAKVSHLADQFLGASHDFRFGVQYSQAGAGGLVGYNDLIYTYSESNPGYGYGISYTPFSYSGDTRALGVYFDDTVRVNDRLSLNLGLRYDYQKAFSAERDQLDEAGNPTGTTYPQTDFFTWNTISPRIGFNLKLTADGRTVLKGHWGRYHRAVATGEYANKIGPSITPIFVGPYDIPIGAVRRPHPVALEREPGLRPELREPVHRPVHPEPGARAPARASGPSSTTSTSAGESTPPGTTSPACTRACPTWTTRSKAATGRTLQLYQLQSDPEDRQFRITNPDGFNSDVNAVSFAPVQADDGQVADDRLRDLAARHRLAPGRPGRRRARPAPGVGIIQRGGLQFRQFGQNPNSFVNVDGRLKSDVDWQFKVQASYQLPLGFLVSANLSSRDGAHLVRRTRSLAVDHPRAGEHSDPAPAARRERAPGGRHDPGLPPAEGLPAGREGPPGA